MDLELDPLKIDEREIRSSNLLNTSDLQLSDFIYSTDDKDDIDEDERPLIFFKDSINKKKIGKNNGKLSPVPVPVQSPLPPPVQPLPTPPPPPPPPPPPTTNTSHKCVYCKNSFQNVDLLFNHLHKSNCKATVNPSNDTINNEKLLQCLLCGKLFDNNSKLHVHMSIKHKGFKPYRCEFCGKSFLQKETFDVHQRLQHFINPEKPYYCTFCYKNQNFKVTGRFSTSVQLIEHMTIMHKKQYKCSFCIKCFCSMYEVKKHENTHSLQRPFKCEYCPEEFSIQSSLQSHVNKVHVNIEENLLHHCSLCDHKFIQSSDLTTHMYVHIDENPFECPDCAEIFDDINLYQEHMKVHFNWSTRGKTEINLNIADAVDVNEKFKDFQNEQINKTNVNIELNILDNDDDYFDDTFDFHTINDNEIDNTINNDKLMKLNDNNIETDLAKLGVTISYTCPDCLLLFNDINEFSKHCDTHKCESDKNVFDSLKKSVDNITTNIELSVKSTIKNSTKQMAHSKKPTVTKLRKIEKPKRSRAPVSLDWQKKDNKIRNYSCQVCNRSFTLASTLSLHNRRTHLGIKPYECTVCGWSFAQSSDLIKHMRKHTGERPYKCKFCKIGFTQNRNLKNHMKMHTEEPCKCKYCNKEFLLETSLAQHLKKHEGDHLYFCSTCNIPYKCENDLKIHTKKSHSIDRQYKCNYCEKLFLKSSDLTKHTRIHTGERPYQCKLCDKTFTHPTSLRNHSAVHTKERPFQCSYCGQSFAFFGNLKVHIRSHTGEKPYSCDICEKTFARTANLNEHKKIHTGEKSYKCEICDKSFTNSSTYSKHKKIHTGERPHKCHLCDKSFIQFAHLTKHIRVHTGEKPFTCKICNKNFRRSDTLASHMKIHQKIISTNHESINTNRLINGTDIIEKLRPEIDLEFLDDSLVDNENHLIMEDLKSVEDLELPQETMILPTIQYVITSPNDPMIVQL